ncbi:E3 ubiquitin-protein ligase rad18 [Thecaphora frezii]
MLLTSLIPSLDDVGDPSDWPAGCEVVKALDSSLRCDLCFDIFTAPVSLKTCSHTFCSTCIRTHINQPGSSGAFCPKCRQNKAYDSELLPVTALETTAESWRKMRPFVMDLWKRVQEADKLRSQALQQSVGSAGTGPSRNGKRKADEQPIEARRRSSRVRSQRNPSAAMATATSFDVGASVDSAYVLSDDDDEAGDASYHEDGGGGATANGRGSAAAEGREHHDLKSDDQVACPICEHRFTVVALNAHLDKNKCYPGCPAPSAQERGLALRPKPQAGASGTAAWFAKAADAAASSSSSAKRLHRPQYSLKSERDLRKLLESLGLPTTGDKEKLAERHRQYVNLYNANLDAAPANRRSEAKLRRELAEWERARDVRGGALLTDKKSQGWLAENRAQYNDLIAQARETAMRDRQRRNRKATPPASTETAANGAAAAAVAAAPMQGDAKGAQAPLSPLKKRGGDQDTGGGVQTSAEAIAE